MAIDLRTASAAAHRRLLASSDPRVREDIEKVLSGATSQGDGKQPYWLEDAASALGRYRQARFGPAAATVQLEAAGPTLVEEAVARSIGRPVYLVRDGVVDIASARSEAAGWADIIQQSAAVLTRALGSIGRIEVDNYLSFMPLVGTGWLVDEGVVVTNRHVAEYFVEREGATMRFRLGRDQVGPVRPRIDYREEFERTAVEEIPIDRIIWVAPRTGPDIAFLGLAPAASTSGRLAIPLARSRPLPKTIVGVIGYPARDNDFWDRELLTRLFGDIYDKKRFAPGNVLDAGDALVSHDCTTLGGNSGSVLLDLASGNAIGLHYAGVPLIENRAVPATVVAQALQFARSQKIEVSPVTTTSSNPSSTGITISSGGESTVKITVPIEITVSVGGSVPASVVGTRLDASSQPRTEVDTTGLIPRPTDEQVSAAVAKARDLIGRRDDVVAIKPGYRFEDGYITQQGAVVIAVRDKQSLATLQDRGVQPLPRHIDGVAVDVTNATFADILVREGLMEAPPPRGHNYRPRTEEKFKLKRVKERMKAILHAGPDAGWPQLEPFLKRTRRRLTVGMFEYTAPHIVEAGLAAVSGANEQMSIVVQKGENIGEDTKINDIPDEETVRRFKAAKGDKFEFVWASIRFKSGIIFANPNGIFDSSYHIKVAVRDRKEFWLSSGSWQSSNQPPFDPIKDGDQRPALINRYNREWHCIIEHEDLAALYEEHLQQDFRDAQAAPMPEAAVAEPEMFVWVPVEYFEVSPEAARIRPKYHPPLALDRVIDVQPLLSPDNYVERVLEVLDNAERSIYFQNQSLKIRPTRPAGYDKLLQTLRQKQKDGLDVRIIFRPFQDIRDDLTAIQRFKFDMSRVKLDKKCHNKGIIIDSSVVVLGSHNWTNAGTSYNRDASLIFFDPEIAEYYGKIYLYDWSRADQPRIDESLPAPRLVRGEEAVPPPRMVKVRMSELELD